MQDESRRTRPLLRVALLVAVCGCAHNPELEPAASVPDVPGRGEGAAVSVESVVVEARAQAWQGQPIDLEEEVTPLWVRIENRSDRPLRVRYEDFWLQAPDGATYAALPPYNVEGEVVSSVDDADRFPAGFSVAPHASAWYPGLTPYTGPFYYDPMYYDRYAWSNVRRVELPTRDMLANGLPEGVVQPGTTIDGFLYFQDVPASVSGVTFLFELVDANSQQVFGRVQIPFVNTSEVDERLLEPSPQNALRLRHLPHRG